MRCAVVVPQVMGAIQDGVECLGPSRNLGPVSWQSRNACGGRNSLPRVSAHVRQVAPCRLEMWCHRARVRWWHGSTKMRGESAR